jgi:hypothetical protein
LFSVEAGWKRGEEYYASKYLASIPDTGDALAPYRVAVEV